MIDLPFCTGCDISGFTLDGHGTATVGVWVDNASSLTTVHNTQVMNMPQGSVAYQSGAASGVVPGETHFSDTNAGNVGTCYLAFGGANDIRISGSNVCAPTAYGVHVTAGSDIYVENVTFASQGGVPITLFQADVGNTGLVINHCYAEEFSNILNAPGSANRTAGMITIENSAFNSNLTSGSIGTYNQNGTLVLNNVQISTPRGGPTFTFDPIGAAGYGTVGVMLVNGGNWTNASLVNKGAVTGNGYYEANDSAYTNYSRNPFSSTRHIFDNRRIGIINSEIAETDNNLKNIYSHYPSTAAGTEQYGWYFNGAYCGGWQSYGTAPSSSCSGGWAAYNFLVPSTGGYNSYNGNVLLPGSAAAYHGSSKGGAQMSDGTGTTGNLSSFSGGTLTDSGLTAATIPTKSGTPTPGAGVCWKTSNTLGTCTAGTWPNCSTCN